MILTLTNIICDVVGGGALSLVFYVLGKKKQSKPKETISQDHWGEQYTPDELGVFPWLFSVKHFKYLCPHCRCKTDQQIVEKFCDCESYHSGHFHFECSQCKFKTIMKTAAKD